MFDASKLISLHSLFLHSGGNLSQQHTGDFVRLSRRQRSRIAGGYCGHTWRFFSGDSRLITSGDNIANSDWLNKLTIRDFIRQSKCT